MQMLMTCCAMRHAQADDSQEAADRFLELSAALEEAESQLAENESQLQSLRDIEQQLQQQVSTDCYDVHVVGCEYAA